MSFKKNIWDIPIPDWEAKNRLTRELSISPITAQVLINRGIHSEEEANIFLYGSLKNLSSPWQLPGMLAAVERIMKAIDKGEKILIYGDYDVDGMTATAILILFLRSAGVEPGYYIPERDEGYGLNEGALDFIKEQGYNLVITVDCGISAEAEVAYGRSLGLDFVITDHHEPGDKLPDLVTIINPKLSKDQKPFSELAGVGVAFKLVQGLADKLLIDPIQIETYLDLVALGTIADMVPLVKENRILVKYGLEKLRKTQRVGIKSLMEVAKLGSQDLGTYQVAFMLAPRLNAAGRMGSSLVSLELLLTNSIQQASENALRLQELNNSRQLLEQAAQKEALELIKKEGEELTDKILVLSSPLWHPGILGIVASRLAENLSRPVILLTIEGEQAKGSGRSFAGFDLFEAVKHCNEFLLKSGGHSQAIGITLETARLHDFKKAINQYAEKTMEHALMKPILDLETFVLLEQLDFQLINELELLEPFGHGNPKPVFAAQGAVLKNCRYVGKNNNHLKCTISWERGILDGIGFNLAEPLNHDLAFEEPMDLAFCVEKNHWNGQTKLQLVLEDLKKYSSNNVPEGTLGLKVTHSTIESKTPTVFDRHYYYSHGSEQLQQSLELTLSLMPKGKKILLTFPSQRILAIYEEFFWAKFAKHGVDCRRLSNQEVAIRGINSLPINSVYLAKENSLKENYLKDFSLIKFLFPKPEIKIERPEKPKHITVGFKDLSLSDYQFVIKPIPLSQKTDYLKESFRVCKKPLIIYANRKNVITNLYYDLRKAFPESKHRIWCYHQGLTHEQKEMVVQATTVGLADIVITSELLELELHGWPGAETKILMDAPYNLEELFLKSRPQKDNVKVLGIWTEEEIQLNKDILKTIYPKQERLEIIFDFLDKEHIYKVKDIKQVISILEHQFPRAQKATLQYVLDIIMELQSEGFERYTVNFPETRAYKLAEAEKQGVEEFKNAIVGEPKTLASFFLAGTN